MTTMLFLEIQPATYDCINVSYPPTTAVLYFGVQPEPPILVGYVPYIIQECGSLLLSKSGPAARSSSC